MGSFHYSQFSLEPGFVVCHFRRTQHERSRNFANDAFDAAYLRLNSLSIAGAIHNHCIDIFQKEV
jgi:hypothetical protein